MPIRTIIKMGNPLLRKVSLEVNVENISSELIQNLIDDLIETMRNYKGVGIAAPQVGELKRIFIMEVDNNERYLNETFPLTVVINPIVDFVEDESQESWEGCLSIPEIRGQLIRAKKVILSGIDRVGTQFKKELIGFPAVIAQHELDHLNGILFIDRMTSFETLSFLDEYNKFWKTTK